MTLADEVRTQPDEIRTGELPAEIVAPTITVTASAAARVQRLLE